MDEKNPEQIQQERDRMAAIKAEKERQLKEVTDAINCAGTDPNVRIILRYVSRLSGFFTNPVVVNAANGDVLVSSSIYNSGRESVYHDMRRLMSAETKNIVERSE